MFASIQRAAQQISQRIHKRADVCCQVNMQSDSNIYMGFSTNISEGGIFVSSYDPPALGSVIDLAFSLPDGQDPIECKGEVRWIRGDTGNPDAPPGYGLKFLEIEPADAERIRVFIEERDPIFFPD